MFKHLPYAAVLALSTVLAAGCAEIDDPELVDETEQGVSTCSFDILLNKAKVTEGQGIAEGALELRFEGSADDSGVISVPGIYMMAVGAPYERIGQYLNTVRVTDTTKTIKIWTEVTDLDNDSYNGNDVGQAFGSMALDCDAGTTTKELTVDLYNNNGDGAQNGQVKVKFLARMN